MTIALEQIELLNNIGCATTGPLRPVVVTLPVEPHPARRFKSHSLFRGIGAGLPDPTTQPPAQPSPADSEIVERFYPVLSRQAKGLTYENATSVILRQSCHDGAGTLSRKTLAPVRKMGRMGKADLPGDVLSQFAGAQTRLSVAQPYLIHPSVRCDAEFVSKISLQLTRSAPAQVSQLLNAITGLPRPRFPIADTIQTAVSRTEFHK